MSGMQTRVPTIISQVLVWVAFAGPDTKTSPSAIAANKDNTTTLPFPTQITLAKMLLVIRPTPFLLRGETLSRTLYSGPTAILLSNSYASGCSSAKRFEKRYGKEHRRFSVTL